MIRRFLLAGAVATALVLLTGCAPGHGVVHGKEFHLAHVVLLPMRVGKATVLVPHTVPSRWELDLYDSHGEHGWTDVDETTYHRYRVGDFYPGEQAAR